jgi:hypothetical protein
LLGRGIVMNHRRSYRDRASTDYRRERSIAANGVTFLRGTRVTAITWVPKDDRPGGLSEGLPDGAYLPLDFLTFATAKL